MSPIPFSSTLHPGSGGSDVPTNYLSVGNRIATFGVGVTPLEMVPNNAEGPAYWALDGDGVHLDCLEAGTYVIAVTCAATVTGVVASPMNVLRVLLETTFADPNALASWVNLEQDLALDQTQDYVETLTLTTPPLVAAPGDTFFVGAGCFFAFPAGVAVSLPHEQDLTCSIVRIA